MKKNMVLVVLTSLIISTAFLFAEGKGSEEMSSMMGKGGMEKGMMTHKMMSMMKEMQGMMMEMMGMMKECKSMKDDKTMMRKMDDMMTRCKEMMEETDDMMSERMKMKKEMMGEEDTGVSSEMPSGHESHR